MKKAEKMEVESREIMKRSREFNGKIEPADMKREAAEYFNMTDKDLWNIASLCKYLNISCAKYKRLKENDEYKNATEFCDTNLQDHYLEQLNGRYPTGAIFALKADFGYSDAKEIKTTVNGKLTIEQILKGAKVKA
jgi:hypothetical protein